MPKTIKGWVLWVVAQALLTFAFRLGYKLLENAVIGWGDDQIAAWLGITAPTGQKALSWGAPFLLAALTLWLYHVIQKHWQRAPAETKTDDAEVIRAQAELERQRRLTLKEQRNALKTAVLAPPSTAVPSTAPVIKKDILKLEFGEDGQFQNIPKHSLYKFTRQFCVRIVNDSHTETVSDCKVQITEIAPWTGIKLPRILKEGFSLASGDSVFIPLANYGEAREQEKYACGDSLIEILGIGKPISIAHDVRSIITIRATAARYPFCEEKCTLWVDENGRLKIAHGGRAETEEPPIANTAMQGQVQHNLYKNGPKVLVGPQNSQFELRFAVANQNAVHIMKDKLTYLARIRGKTKGDVLKLTEYPSAATSFVVTVGERFIAMKGNGQMLQGKIIEVKDDRTAEYNEVTFDYIIAPARGGDFIAL